MPTNDERREVAKRIREMYYYGGIKRSAVFYEALNDVIMGQDGFGSFQDIAARLADLIEPEERTCEWVSVDDRLPDCKGEYIVAYHPCHWDYVDYDKVRVGTDSFSGKSSWAKRKYQRVTHWMTKPEPPSAKVVEE